MANDKIERRLARRYPIVLRARWRALKSDATYSGSTVNMSHRGLLLESDTSHMLQVGANVVINIAWPATFENGTLLMLKWRGKIVRVAGSLIAINHVEHEFKIRPQRRPVTNDAA